MNDKSKMWKVYPTEYVSGFVATYCMDFESAWMRQGELGFYSGVDWAIEAPSDNAARAELERVERLMDEMDNMDQVWTRADVRRYSSLESQWDELREILGMGVVVG